MDIDNFLKNNLLAGRLCEGAQQIQGGQHPLWQGFVSTRDSEVEAYIKNCQNPDALLVEIIVALIGRVYGLPIPRPIVIKLEPDHPDIPLTKTTFIFGSEAKKCPNFSRFLREFNEREEMILDYDKLHQIITFDELIANPDRNNNNILFDGRDFHFIDHEYCFNYMQNPKAEIMDQACKTGNISDIYKHYLGANDVQVHKFLTKVRAYVKDDIKATSNDAFALLKGVKTDDSSYHKKVEFVRSFIINRLPVLDVLVKNSISTNLDDDQLFS